MEKPPELNRSTTTEDEDVLQLQDDEFSSLLDEEEKQEEKEKGKREKKKKRVVKRRKKVKRASLDAKEASRRASGGRRDGSRDRSRSPFHRCAYNTFMAFILAIHKFIFILTLFASYFRRRYGYPSPPPGFGGRSAVRRHPPPPPPGFRERSLSPFTKWKLGLDDGFRNSSSASRSPTRAKSSRSPPPRLVAFRDLLGQNLTIPYGKSWRFNESFITFQALAKDPHSGEAKVRSPAERGLLAAGRAQWRRRRAEGDESSPAVGRGGAGALQVAAAGEEKG